MIIQFNGKSVSFGGKFVKLNTSTIKVGDISYETVKIGNYLWTTANLKNHLTSGSSTHEDNEFYRRDAIPDVKTLLPEGWIIPDYAAFTDLYAHRDEFNFIYCGYETDGGTWNHSNDRCYMMGDDSTYTFLMYWFTKTDTPTYDEPTIKNAYSSNTGYRFPIRICKKV